MLVMKKNAPPPLIPEDLNILMEQGPGSRGSSVALATLKEEGGDNSKILKTFVKTFGVSPGFKLISQFGWNGNVGDDR